MNMHLAGIIPVANLKTDFEIDTPAVLLPVCAGFTAIQKSALDQTPPQEISVTVGIAVEQQS